MAVKKYYKTFEGQVIEAIQDAEEMSPAEESALRNAIGGDFTAVESNTVRSPKEDISKQAPTQKSVFNSVGQFRGADYKTGVTNNLFRLRFSNTNNFKERVNFLDKNVGKEGYVVDKLGDFLLTPKGQEEIGMEPTNNLMSIDEDALRGEDIIDIIGESGVPALASVAGFEFAAKLLPKLAPAIIRGPFGGFLSFGLPILASGAGAYAGTFLDEAQQYARGISEESFEDVTGRAETEMTYALAGDVIFGGAGRLVGRYLKGSPGRQLDYYYGEGASNKKSEIHKKVFAEFDKTGLLVPQETGVLFDLNQNVIPDLYSDSNIRNRIALITENIAGTRNKKFTRNSEQFKKLVKESMSTTEETRKFLEDPDADKLIEEAVSKSINTSTDDFINSAGRFSESIKDNLKGALSGLLKVSDGGPQKMDDVVTTYTQMQDKISKQSRQATEDGQRIASIGFRKLDNVFEKVTPPSNTTVQLRDAPPEIVLTPVQQAEVDQIAGKSLKQKTIDNFIQENTEKSAGRTTVQNYDDLGSDNLTAIDENIENIIGSELPEDINRLNFLKGIRDEADVNLIKDGKGNIIYAFKNSERGPGLVQTQYTLKALESVLEQNPKLFNNVESGVLKTLSKSLKEGFKEQPLAFLTPNEHNELITTLRKVVVEENIDLSKVWTASVKDGEVSYAALASGMKAVEKEGFEGAKKGTPEYIEKMQATKSLGDIGIRFSNLITEQKDFYNLTEQFQLGMVVNRIKKNKLSPQPLIEKLLTPERGVGSANIKAILRMFDEAPKRSERSMYQQIKKSDADEFLPEYVEEVNKISIEDIPLTSSDKAQQAAEQVIKKEAAAGNKLAKNQERTLTRLKETEAVSDLEKIDRKITRQGVEASLVSELLTQLSSNTSTKEFAKKIRIYASNGSVDATGDRGDSTLKTLLGEEGENKLKEIADTIESLTIQSPLFGGNEAAGKAIDDLFNKAFMESNESLANLSSRGTGTRKEIDSLLDNFSKQIEGLSTLKNKEFATDIRQGNFIINGKVDIDKFVDTMFKKDVFKTAELKTIMDKIPEIEKQALRQRYLDSQLSKILGDASMQADASITEITKIFNGDFIQTLINDKTRFKIIFGEGSTESLEQIVRLGKRIKKGSESGDFGKLAAAAIAIGIAAAPIAVLTGNIPLAVGIGVGARYFTISQYAKLLNDPVFIRKLAEPRFWTPGANNTSEKIAINLNRLSEAAIQSLSQTDNAAEKRYNIEKNRLEDDRKKSSSFSSRILLPLLNPLQMPDLDIARTIGSSIKKVTPKKQSYTPLPNVQDFRQSEDVFSEINRRRALSGNNPNTQALADRNR